VPLLLLLEYIGFSKDSRFPRSLDKLLETLNFDVDYKQNYAPHHFYIELNHNYEISVEAYYKASGKSFLCHLRFIAQSPVQAETFKSEFQESCKIIFGHLTKLRDDGSSERNYRSYAPIHRVENLLRELIVLRYAEERFGSWERYVPLGKKALSTATSRRDKDMASDPIEAETTSLLHYLDLNELLNLISSDKERFGKDLSDDDFKALKLLKDLRNRLAHNRFITEGDYQQIAKMSAQITTRLRTNLNRFQNPY
jgi:hypothetical protein